MGVCELTDDLTYYMYTSPVDMRKQIVGLQGLVTSQMGRYPVAGEAFVFMGKNRKTIKIIHREGRGITMYVRKLNIGCFSKPSFDLEKQTCTLDYRTFMMLVRGDNIDL